MIMTMSARDLSNLLAILRRCRQVTCGFCWAVPGRRCWQMIAGEHGHLVPGSTRVQAVHPERVFRAFRSGMLSFDMDPEALEIRARREEERLGVSVPPGMMAA